MPDSWLGLIVGSVFWRKMAKRDIRKVMIVSLAGYSCLGANNITCDFFSPKRK